MILEDFDNEELERRYEALLNQIPSRAPIFIPTDKIPLLDRIRGIEHVKQIYGHDLDAIYRPKLRALRAAYKGRERCFVIGNGPSLNQTDLAMLKDEVTFAVNGFFLKAAELNWKPTFYCVEDHLVAEDRARWINEFHGPIKLFPAYLGYMFPPADDTIFYNHRPRKSYPNGFDFSTEADKITYTGCTVTFSLLQLAHYLGFKESYLIGVDASYDIPADVQTGSDYAVGVLDMKSDDTNHFHPDYFGKGFRWHDPQVHKMLEAYAEARRVVDETDQRIYNATIGGKLEVFERRSFQSLFPQARPAGEMVRQHAEKLLAAEQVKAAQGAFPRLLILDMTAMGNGTATGEIKANLLQGWPDANLLQVASPGKDRLELVRRFAAGFVNAEQSESDLRAAIVAFDPEVILYRPLADHPHLHDFAMTVLGATDVPLVSWIMDDWPARLQAEDPARFAAVQADLLQVLARSALRLSISQAMSAAFAARYGMSFQAIANGVDPADWTAPRQHVDGPVLVRYAGGLAPDMNAESVQRVAHVVERMAQAGQDIRFEISTRPHWAARSGALFAGLRSTRLDTESRPFAAYADWLCAADVALIAYNFDAASLRYVRYSMANKLPECLASGAALLVHGPRGVATVDYLAGTAAAVLADQPTEAAIEAALTGLLAAEARSGLGRAARTLAFERHSLPVLAAWLQQSIITAARPLADAAVSAPAQDAVVPRNEIHLFAGAEALSAEPLGPDAAREHLAGQGVSGVMLCPDPRLILAARIANGTGPLAALHDWQQDTAAHMALYRQNRSKLVLTEAGAAATAPDAVLAALAGRAADAGFAGAFPASLPAQDPGQPDPVWLALAGQLLRENPVAARLHSECQASALPLAEANPDAAPGTGTLAAITRYQAVLADLAASKAAFDLRAARLAEEVVAHAATAKAHAASVQSHETQLAAAAGDAASAVVLRAQLQQLRLTAEAFHADAATLRDAAAATQGDLQALHARIGVLSGEHADLSAALARKDALLSEAQLRLAETNAALLAKVARATRLETDLELRIEKVLRLETAIKQANKQTATANRERDAARSAGDEARRTLDQIYRSKSWLATAPMRTLRRMLTPGS